MKRGQLLIKHYTFDSRLSPEQVRARLLPDGGFYLVKTGGMWQVKPLLPFADTVTAALPRFP